MACRTRPGDTCKDIRGGKSLSQIRPIQPGFYLLIGDVWIEMNLLSHTLTQLNARNLQRGMRTVSKHYQSSLWENFLVGLHPFTALYTLALSSIKESGRTLTCDSASTFKQDSDYRPWWQVWKRKPPAIVLVYKVYNVLTEHSVCNLKNWRKKENKLFALVWNQNAVLDVFEL